jgi:hypothetical protein
VGFLDCFAALPLTRSAATITGGGGGEGGGRLLSGG